MKRAGGNGSGNGNGNDYYYRARVVRLERENEELRKEVGKLKRHAAELEAMFYAVSPDFYSMPDDDAP